MLLILNRITENKAEGGLTSGEVRGGGAGVFAVRVVTNPARRRSAGLAQTGDGFELARSADLLAENAHAIFLRYIMSF